MLESNYMFVIVNGRLQNGGLQNGKTLKRQYVIVTQ